MLAWLLQTDFSGGQPMQTRRGAMVPADLLRVAKRFAKWRERHEVGTRIPEPLWRAAVELAERHGVCRTATALKLGYYALKERVEERTLAAVNAGQSSPRSAFVELPPASVSSSDCVIEFEKGSGWKMSVHLKGIPLPDLVALAHSFWDAR
jgi:hypothetical protein